MLPFEAHRPRGDRRPRRRPTPVALERLEERRVLNYSPLGYSPPDLTVVGEAPPVAAYGGPITVSVDVVNLGHSSLVEPLALEQGAPSRADATPSVVGVYLSADPNRLTRTSVRIGEIAVPMVRQNSVVELTQTFFMPADRPRGFPGNGGNVYVFFRADDLRQTIDLDRTNNLQRAAEPLQIAAPLPDLEAIAIDVPPVMQPGDVIQPSFKIANYGTTLVAPQGPILVQLVASTDQSYGPTDVVLGNYFLEDILPLSTVPTRGPVVLGDVNLDNPNNVVTFVAPPVQLPPGPAVYNIGLVVDPFDQIREIREIAGPRGSGLQLARRVGPPIPSLPPAGVQGEPAPVLNSFPIPAFGPIISPAFQPRDTLDLFVPIDTGDPFADLLQARARGGGPASARSRAGRLDVPSLPPGGARFPGGGLRRA